MEVFGVILTFLKLFLFCLTTGGTTALLTKRRFGEAFPLTLMGMSIFIMLCGICFGHLSFGYIVALLWGGAFPLLLIYHLWRHKVAYVLRYILTPGFLALGIVLIIVMLMDQEAMFSYWDEFTHWGPMVKIMYGDDIFYSASKLSLANREYPPVVQIFETFVCSFLGNFSESNIYKAIQILTFSFTLPFIEHMSNRFTHRIDRILVAVFLIFVLMFVFILFGDQNNFFSCIYTDAILAVESGSLFYAIWQYDFSLFATLYLLFLATFILLVGCIMKLNS